MSFLRKTSEGLTKSIRKITLSNVVKIHSMDECRAAGASQSLVTGRLWKPLPMEGSHANRVINYLKNETYCNPDCMWGKRNPGVFHIPSGGRMAFTSDVARVERMLVVFDHTIDIKYVGMMGDFAIWAVTDDTGEILYLIDDNDW